MGRTVLPFCVRACGSRSLHRLCTGGTANADQANNKQEIRFHKGVGKAVPTELQAKNTSIPMDFLWTPYGTIRSQHRSNTGAFPDDHATPKCPTRSSVPTSPS